MKKIITNTIMKKAICATLLIMIVFQFMFPNFVWAAIEYDDGEATGTYAEWRSKIEKDKGDMTYFENQVREALEVQALLSRIDDGYVQIDGTNLKLSSEGELDFLKENENVIILLCEVDNNGVFSSVIKLWDVADGEGGYERLMDRVKTFAAGNKEEMLTYQEFKDYINTNFGISDEATIKELLVEPLKEWLNEGVLVETEKELTDAEVRGLIDHEGNDYKIIDMLLIEINKDTTAVEELVEKVIINGLNSTNMSYYLTDYNAKQGESADAGGLLLDLIFPFVNFVADTLLSFLGEIMTGVDGLEQKEIKPANAESLTKEDVFEADISAVGAIDKIIGGVEGYVVSYSPEEIFSGEVELLSIDFISGKVPVRDANGNIVKDENGNITYKTNSNDGWNNIRQVIAQWYKVLRMIAIIGLLSVLIYTGIKIIISSNSKDKAKYKEWIVNWFIAVAILFFMHYIMSFVISTTGQISQLITASSQEIIVEKCDEGELQNKKVNTDNLFVTNLMGYVRFKVQTNDWKAKLGYEVMFIALVVYTFKFTFVYLKRVLNMAFLTLIAPIVALTYPIDKLNDGSAQGFQMWLKEYIFNALLQPMHLIMYYILVSSAIGLAAENPLYAIVVLMFMSEAEKLLKKIFGFDKAGGGTVGGMTSAFAAGALASNVKNIARMISKGSSGNSSNSRDDKNLLDNPKQTQSNDFSEFDNMLIGNEGEQQRTQQNEQQEPDLVSERRALEEFEEEGALSNTWTDGDYEAYQQLEQEQLERERQQRERNAQLEANNDNRNGSEEEPQPQQQPQQQVQQPEIPEPATPTPIDELAQRREERRAERQDKRQRVSKGLKTLGKQAVKPIWDFDRSGKYNRKRLRRGIVKGALGAGIGITAAAVQAGISITDGKYSPMEGIATLGAGYAGGKGIVNKFSKTTDSIISTYKEGAYAGNKQKQMERAQERFADREDVIAFNKKEYPSDPKAAMERERDHYLPYGVTDLKEMKSCMKYANSLEGMSQVEADRRAAKVANFRKQLKDQGQSGAIYDKKKQAEYIDAMVKQAAPEEEAKIRNRYQNLFNAAQAFDKAQT